MEPGRFGPALASRGKAWGVRIRTAHLVPVRHSGAGLFRSLRGGFLLRRPLGTLGLAGHLGGTLLGLALGLGGGLRLPLGALRLTAQLALRLPLGAAMRLEVLLGGLQLDRPRHRVPAELL